MYSSREMCIPVQKYKFQYKNMYSSTKIYIPVRKYIYFSAEINIYSSAEICKFLKRNIYIPEQKYMFQYRVLSQYRNKYSSTELYLSTEIALPGSRLKYFPRPLCGPTHVFEIWRPSVESVAVCF